MKISESRLRKIILEESKRVLSESIAPMRDSGPFERGDKVIVHRRGSAPHRGTVMNRRKVSGLRMPGIVDGGDKYIYDVMLGGDPGKIGARLERMIPGEFLTRAGPLDSIMSGDFKFPRPDPSGRDDSSSGYERIFSLLDDADSDEYLDSIDDIKNEIEEGNDVVVELSPLAATIMAAYSNQYEGGSNRFTLTSSSAANLAQFASTLDKLVTSPALGRYAMNENPVAIIGGGLIAVAIIGIIAMFAKGENDSRRQARHQAEMLKLARYGVENGCEVEVETNSSASSNADPSGDADYRPASGRVKGSGRVKADTKNDASGRIVIKSCRPRSDQA